MAGNGDTGMAGHAPSPSVDVPEQGNRVCQACRRPVPTRHRHVLDAERCAVFCICPHCSKPHLPVAAGKAAGRETT